MARHLRQMPDDPFVGHVRKDSIERLRKQAERQAGMIFNSVYLLFLLIFSAAAVIVSQVRELDHYVWLPGILFGPALIGGVAAMAYYTIETWDLPPTDD